MADNAPSRITSVSQNPESPSDDEQYWADEEDNGASDDDEDQTEWSSEEEEGEDDVEDEMTETSRSEEEEEDENDEDDPWDQGYGNIPDMLDSIRRLNDVDQRNDRINTMGVLHGREDSMGPLP